jgi:hypothetical protein
LNAGDYLAAFLNQAPFNGSSSFEGTFTFSSSVPLAAVAMRDFTNQRGDFLLTPVTVARTDTSTSGSETVADFVDGGGWSTDILLTNATNNTAQGTLLFYGQGTPSQAAQPLSMTVNGRRGSTFNYAIPPHSGLKLTTAGQGGRPAAGSVRIVSFHGATPQADAIISYTNNSGITTAETAIPGTPTGTWFQLYAEASGVPGQLGSVQTGFAIANPSGANVAVTLALSNADGSPAGSPATVTVPAFGQVAEYLQTAFPNLPASFQGFVTLTSSSAVSMTGLGLTYNERGDLLLTATPPRNNTALPAGQEVTFPQIFDGAGYTTDLVVFGGAGSGTLEVDSQ